MSDIFGTKKAAKTVAAAEAASAAQQAAAFDANAAATKAAAEAQAKAIADAAASAQQTAAQQAAQTAAIAAQQQKQYEDQLVFNTNQANEQKSQFAAQLKLTQDNAAAQIDAVNRASAQVAAQAQAAQAAAAAAAARQEQQQRDAAKSSQAALEGGIAREAAVKSANELLDKPIAIADVTLASDTTTNPDAVNEIDPETGRKRTTRSPFMAKSSMTGITIA